LGSKSSESIGTVKSAGTDKWANEKGWVGKTHLDAEIASVYIVSEEEVAGLGGLASDFEELHEIKLRL
jgi:hypothetical protein